MSLTESWMLIDPQKAEREVSVENPLPGCVQAPCECSVGTTRSLREQREADGRV
jgi:hypothetical protein